MTGDLLDFSGSSNAREAEGSTRWSQAVRALKHGSADPRGKASRVSQVGPGDPDAVPARQLANHDPRVASRAGRHRLFVSPCSPKRRVLHQSVELEEDAVLGPGEVQACHDPSACVVDCELGLAVREDLRASMHIERRVSPTDSDPGSQAEHEIGGERTGDALIGSYRVCELEHRRQLPMQQVVGDAQAALDGASRGELDQAARSRVTRNAVTLHDVVLGGVRLGAGSTPRLPAAGSSVQTGHVDVRRSSPHVGAPCSTTAEMCESTAASAPVSGPLGTSRAARRSRRADPRALGVGVGARAYAHPVAVACTAARSRRRDSRAPRPRGVGSTVSAASALSRSSKAWSVPAPDACLNQQLRQPWMTAVDIAARSNFSGIPAASRASRRPEAEESPVTGIAHQDAQ